MSWIDGIKLINKAREKIAEQKDWEMWIALLPNMDKNTFIPFDKFRKQGRNKGNINKTSKEEIISKAEELKLIHQGKHAGILPFPKA